MEARDEMGPERSWGGDALPRPPFPVTGRQGPAGPGDGCWGWDGVPGGGGGGENGDLLVLSVVDPCPIYNSDG